MKKGWLKSRQIWWGAVLLMVMAGPAAGELMEIPESVFDTPTPQASGTPAATPDKAGPSQDNGFIVLCYHRFVARPETVKGPLSQYRLPVADFKWQMQYLKDQGITPISMEQLKAYWFEGKPLPDKAVLLTFDDGFRSIYEKAYPVVKEFGYPGVLFLYSDFIRSQSDSMRYEEIAEMAKNGFDLESHTKTHPNLGLEAEKRKPADFRKFLKLELDDPIRFIEDKFGIKPQVLAYSYGVFNGEVLSQTKVSGYKMAFTVNPGPNDRTVPVFKLKRNLVLYPISHENFAKIFEDKVLHLEKFDPGDGEIIESHEPTVTGIIRDEIDPKTLSFQLGNRTLPVQYDPTTHAFKHHVKNSLKAGGHMLTVSAKDLKGQSRVYTWYFRVRHKNLQKEDENELPTTH